MANLAKQVALADIREELAKQGKSYIRTSLRQLRLRNLNEYTNDDIFCNYRGFELLRP